MANEISIKLSVEGEDQYLQTIEKCNTAFKEMVETLKNVTSEYENHAKGLESSMGTQEGYGKILENQKNLFSGLKSSIDMANEGIEKYNSISKSVSGFLGSLSDGLSILDMVQSGISLVGVSLEVLGPIVEGVLSKMAESNRQITAMTEKAAKLSTVIDESKSSFVDSKETIQESSFVAEIYSAKLFDLENEMKALEDQGRDTTTQQSEYKALVDKLNQNLPELNLQLDEQTGLLIGGTEALEEQLEAWEEIQLAKAFEEEYIEIFAAQSEAILELSANMTVYNELVAEEHKYLSEMEQVYEQINEELGLSKGEIESLMGNQYRNIEMTEEQRVKFGELISELNDLDINLQDVRVKQDVYTEAISISRQEIANASAELETMKNEYETLSLAIQNSNTVMAESSPLYMEMQLTIDSLNTRMEDLKAQYEAAYTSAYNSISGQMQLFKNYELDSTVSLNGITGSLDAQIGFMSQYAENMRTLSDWGINQGFLQTLTDGSVESASILQAIVSAGQENIEELNEKLGQVETGKADFADTMADMETDFTEKIDKIGGTMEALALSMDQSREAHDATAATMIAAIAGLRENYYSLCYWKDKVAREMSSIGSGRTRNSHMAGLGYVPFDGYVAELHEGERVLTATQARAHDIAQTGSGIVRMRIPSFAYGYEEANYLKKSNDAGVKAKEIAGMVRQMLKGTSILLDDEKVGEFAVKKVTEEVFV